jgi:hypothetical protein
MGSGRLMLGQPMRHRLRVQPPATAGGSDMGSGRLMLAQPMRYRPRVQPPATAGGSDVTPDSRST